MPFTSDHDTYEIHFCLVSAEPRWTREQPTGGRRVHQIQYRLSMRLTLLLLISVALKDRSDWNVHRMRH